MVLPELMLAPHQKRRTSKRTITIRSQFPPRPGAGRRRGLPGGVGLGVGGVGSEGIKKSSLGNRCLAWPAGTSLEGVGATSRIANTAPADYGGERTMAWNWLWPTRRPAAVGGRHILFYTRDGCHLCEQAWEIVTAAQRRYGFTLERVDVDGDAALAKEHGECVPVVAIDGKVRFRGRVNAVLLERMLRKKSACASGGERRGLFPLSKPAVNKPGNSLGKFLTLSAVTPAAVGLPRFLASRPAQPAPNPPASSHPKTPRVRRTFRAAPRRKRRLRQVRLRRRTARRSRRGCWLLSRCFGRCSSPLRPWPTPALLLAGGWTANTARR